MHDRYRCALGTYGITTVQGHETTEMSIAGQDWSQYAAGTEAARRDASAMRWGWFCLGLVMLGGFLALTATSRAAPASRAASEGLISPENRVKDGDTTTGPAASPVRVAAVGRGGRVSPSRNFRAEFQPGRRRSIPHPYSIGLLQYPLPPLISQPKSQRQSGISVAGWPPSGRNAMAISQNTGDGSADGRLLFQLGVAFAVAYALFLAAWFWGTRERRSRVGGAARS